MLYRIFLALILLCCGYLIYDSAKTAMALSYAQTAEENFIIATSFVVVAAPFICFPSICLWALFGSSIKLIIKNAKIKKTIEYLLALLLVITAVIIVID